MLEYSRLHKTEVNQIHSTMIMLMLAECVGTRCVFLFLLYLWKVVCGFNSCRITGVRERLLPAEKSGT